MGGKNSITIQWAKLPPAMLAFIWVGHMSTQEPIWIESGSICPTDPTLTMAKEKDTPPELMALNWSSLDHCCLWSEPADASSVML